MTAVLLMRLGNLSKGDVPMMVARMRQTSAEETSTKTSVLVGLFTPAGKLLVRMLGSAKLRLRLIKGMKSNGGSKVEVSAATVPSVAVNASSSDSVCFETDHRIVLLRLAVMAGHDRD